jgi:uncharacterized protein YkwD
MEQSLRSRLGGWEKVEGSDGSGDSLPDTVVNEVGQAVEAYERVHGEVPRTKSFEVEYGDHLYRVRFERKEGEASRVFYRAPNASAAYRTVLGTSEVVAEATSFATKAPERVGEWLTHTEKRRRRAAFSAFTFFAVVLLIAGMAGGFVGGSATSPDEVNVTGVKEYPNSTDKADNEAVRGGYFFSSAEAERLVIEESNAVRAERGLKETERVEGLSEAATEQAENMAENDYVGHTTPSGEDVGERYVGTCEGVSSDEGSDSASVGKEGGGATVKEIRYNENAASAPFSQNLEEWGNTTLENEDDVAEFVVEAWMGSKEHRENLLDPDHRGMGVGVYLRDDGTVFTVQALC